MHRARSALSGLIGLCPAAISSSRLTRDPSHLDSSVDVAGYAALLREVPHAR